MSKRPRQADWVPPDVPHHPTGYGENRSLTAFPLSGAMTMFPLAVVRDLVEEAYRLGYSDADNGKEPAL